MAPAALVTKVSDALWRECVCSLSERVDAIMVDISKPTPNLQWEIDQMRDAGLKCVFIAEKGHLKSWTSAAMATDSKSPDSQVLCSLEHDRVLAYDGNARDGGNAFARSLQQLLTDAATSTPKRRRSLKISALYFRVSRFIRKALLWGTLGLATAYSGAAIGRSVDFWQMRRNNGPDITQLYYRQPLAKILLDNDFMLDLLFFARYQDVCEGYSELERLKQLEYLRQEEGIE